MAFGHIWLIRVVKVRGVRPRVLGWSRVWKLVCKVQGVRIMVQGVGLRVEGVGFRVEGLAGWQGIDKRRETTASFGVEGLGSIRDYRWFV